MHGEFQIDTTPSTFRRCFVLQRNNDEKVFNVLLTRSPWSWKFGFFFVGPLGPAKNKETMCVWIEARDVRPTHRHVKTQWLSRTLAPRAHRQRPPRRQSKPAFLPLPCSLFRNSRKTRTPQGRTYSTHTSAHHKDTRNRRTRAHTTTCAYIRVCSLSIWLHKRWIEINMRFHKITIKKYPRIRNR